MLSQSVWGYVLRIFLCGVAIAFLVAMFVGGFSIIIGHSHMFFQWFLLSGGIVLGFTLLTMALFLLYMRFFIRVL